MKRTNNFNKLNSHYSTSIDKYINSYLIQNDLLILYFSDFNLDNYSKINVYLKNIKTLELLNCIFEINENSIIIDLSNLRYLCTDYEYSIILTFETLNSYNIVYPKVNNTTKEKSFISPSSHDNINWYIRILDNGKIRLSTVYLFSKISSNFNSNISL